MQPKIVGRSAGATCAPSVTDLISDKKVCIFGGHINWRNKLAAEYPALSVMDGHQSSFSKRAVLNADMVLLNTKNMSHTVYSKVIAVLRKNDIPFGYIGKHANVDLLEQELATALSHI